jgi:membrane-associated phospholipid phosphatase
MDGMVPQMSGSARGVDPHASEKRFGTRAVIVFVLAFVLAVLFAVVVLLVSAKFDPLLRLDRNTANELHGYAVPHHAFTRLMKLASDIGTSAAWAVILLPVIAWLLFRKLRRLALFVAVTMIGNTALNNLIKLTVKRARPHLTDPVAAAGGNSFPSGHSQSAIVGYGILLAVFIPVIPRRWRPLAVGLAAALVLLIGFSRIALGVHYLSDVIGAYLIGLLWLLGMIGAFRAWRRDEGEPPAPVSEGLEPDKRDELAP